MLADPAALALLEDDPYWYGRHLMLNPPEDDEFDLGDVYDFLNEVGVDNVDDLDEDQLNRFWYKQGFRGNFYSLKLMHHCGSCRWLFDDIPDTEDFNWDHWDKDVRSFALNDRHFPATARVDLSNVPKTVSFVL